MMSASLVNVGRPIVHIEGPEKVTGRAKYTADIALPGLLWGKCLRSPFPHARIVAIDTARARQLPGVHAVITAADLPNVLTGKSILDMPVLARDKVRFVGEKVAAVAADSPDIAEEALSLIDVTYEELPAVFDPVAAVQQDAPRVHDDPAAYTRQGRVTFRGFQPSIPSEPNAMSRLVHRHGDVEAGFAQADHIFEHTFFVPAVHHAYLEPHACIVQIEADGKINVWLTSKMPFPTRSELAHALGVPEERIRVNQAFIGGDFGGKNSFMDAAVCYYLAERTGRPVKMVMTYTEELMAANPRHDGVITFRTGVTKDGRITARQAKLIFNAGAYGAFEDVAANLPGIQSAGGPYRTPNLEIESLNVYTNTVPRGYMRGPALPQIMFGLESQMDIIAHELGLDPLEVRLRNVLEEEDPSSLGEPLQGIRGKETLLAAVEAAGWGTPKPANVGRGIALFDRGPRSWPSSMTVRIDADAHVTLLTSIPDTGTGSHTVLQQIVAEAMEVPFEAVSVVTGDTDTAPFDAGIGASRVTYTAGQATLAAVREVRQALIGLAARLLECAPDQVRYERGRLIADDGRELSLAELMAQAAELEEAPITRTGSYHTDNPPGVTSFCAQVAEVEVDRETGQVKLRKVVTAHDVGTIINPLAHQGQIEGGLVQGIGQALIEHLQIEDGVVTTLNLGDYKLPTPADIPELTTVLLEPSAGELPYEGKHIGETSNVPIVAAIANAVFDAVGVRLMDLPVTTEKVYRGLQLSS